MVRDPADSTSVKLGSGPKFQTIEYPEGTHKRTKDRVEAVAWATYRRGREAWEGNNLPSRIATYLTELGYPMSNNDARYVIEWVEKNKFGYFEQKAGPNGRTRYVKFNFYRNFDISKCRPDGLKTEEQKKDEKAVVATLNGDSPNTGVTQPVDSDPIEKLKAEAVKAASPVVAPPLPFEAPKPRPYLLDELDAKLIAWADVDPEGYAKWIDSVIESFGYAS